MKKILTTIICFLLCAATAISLVACNNNAVSPPPGGWPNPDQDTDRAHYDDATTLVVYFSMPETTDPDNMTTEEANSTVVIDGKVLGNTQYMAYVIQDTAGANIFRIIPETPYPTDHETLVDLASDEQDADARPAIRDAIPADEFAQYETVFVGYPNWWGDMPMILYTFFETYDFAGKTIIPFNTHGGSGFSGTRNSIRTLEPNAVVDDGLSISRNSIQDAEQQIVDWVNTFDLTPSSTPSEPEIPAETSEILIVYFSWSTSGNTERMANYIAEKTGGDIVEIIPLVPYTGSYNDVAYGRAQEEAETNARPEISGETYAQIDLSDYDTVLIGFPIWWHTAPMIIGTFLEYYDWTAEFDIYPFFQGASNSNSEYYANTMTFIRDCAEGASVHEGLYASQSNTQAIDNYLSENGLAA